MRFSTRILAALLVCASVLAAMPARAEILLSPTVTVRASYDDSTLGKGESDGELALSPAATLDMRGEASRAVFKARLDAYRYLDHDEYARENAQVSADLTHSPGARLDLRLAGRWSRDHTVEDEFEESGVTTEKVARNTWSASPGLPVNSCR